MKGTPISELDVHCLDGEFYAETRKYLDRLLPFSYLLYHIYTFYAIENKAGRQSKKQNLHSKSRKCCSHYATV